MYYLRSKSRNGRPSLDEFVASFLKVLGHIWLRSEVEVVEPISKMLALNLPSLIAAELLSVEQMIQMAAIAMYTTHKVESDDGNQPFIDIAVDMIGSILNACLVPAYSLPTDQLMNYRYLAVVKVVLDWFRLHFHFLVNPIMFHRHSLWSAAAKLLNELQISLG